MKKADQSSLRAALSKSFVILDPDVPLNLQNINVKNLGISKERLARALNPPYAPKGMVMHDVFVKSPFAPLERLDAPETAAWVDRQTQRFKDYLAGAAAAEAATKAKLTAAMKYDFHTLPRCHGGSYFRLFQAPDELQAHIEMSGSENGPWKTIVDPNKMNEEGIVSISDWVVSPNGKRVAYFLSKAGSDVTALHVFNVESGQDMPEVLTASTMTAALQNKVPTVLWDKDSHDGFLYSDNRFGVVRHHTVGAAADDDYNVFAARPTAYARPQRLAAGKYEWMYEGAGTDRNTGLSYRPFGSGGAFTEIVAPQVYALHPVAELEDGSVLAITNKDAPRSKLVSFRPGDPAPEKWRTVVPESDTDVLKSVTLHTGKLVATYTHDAAAAVKVFTEDGKHLHDMPLPVQSLAVFGQGERPDGKLGLKICGFKSMGDFYTYDPATNDLAFDKKGPGKVNLDDCIVERLYATSKDSTRVPMTVIRRPDTVLDGTAAVKLTGYGGFNISRGPRFDEAMWNFVNSGGIYVQTNLRGGGEFGQAWYDQGRLLNKQNVFDDFAACAQKLIADKYTQSKRLVIEGGSNGGLLTSATMLQHPKLFGAVVTHVPVTDMLGLRGAWASDYGRPDKIKEDFNAAARYSPVHNVKKGVKYPPHLIITGDHDDRVNPWHAYKLAAALQSQSHKDNITLLNVEKDAGHGAGKSTAQIIREDAEVFAFIEKAIGPVNQQAYKEKLSQDQKTDFNATGKRKTLPAPPAATDRAAHRPQSPRAQ